MAEFVIPKKIITGKGSADTAIEYIGKMGSKALIVTGKIVEKQDCFKKFTGKLTGKGIAYSVFTGITGEPDDKMIEEGLKAYREAGCDFFIGIGGGSPLDSMKAIAALSVKGGKIPDYMGKEISGSMPPMAAIPTTAGTGSEATKFTVITDSEKGIKMLLKGDGLVPDLAVIDPEFTMSSPKSVTAATGLDALTHAVESFTSRKRQPLTSDIALSAVKRIFKWLPEAYNNGTNEEAREQMSIAALEAGIAINNASVTLVHGMSRPIGALFHVPHGISNAMLLEKCLSFAADGDYPLFGELGRAIGAASDKDSDEAAAKAFISAVGELCGKCGVPTLEGYGIEQEKFFGVMEKMANDAAASGSPANTIKEVSVKDMLAIYESLWS
ncbi:MAG: iron-containing alcohol dehydrogenase [Ruminiclostridium sp.]